MSLELLPSEIEIVGSWVSDEEFITGDSNEQRIEWLLKNSLNKLARDWSGWELLYQDFHDQRFGN